MGTVKFSILIPVYNVKRYIGECLDSVLSQTYDNFEVIVIDDGSQDGSGSICDDYACRSPKIKVFHQNNQGLMMSRKNAVLRAEGEYCLFLDADDCYSRDLLGAVSNFLKQHVCEVMIFNKTYLYDGKVIPCGRLSKKDEVIDCREAMKRLLTDSNYYSIFTKVVKTRLILENLDRIYVPINYSEDLLQSVHFFSKADKIGVMNRYLYYYRMRKSSLIHKISVEKITEVLRISDLIAATAENYGCVELDAIEEYRSWVLNDIMDNLYRMNISEGKVYARIQSLKKVVVSGGFCELNRKEYDQKLKWYNRFRIMLLNHNCYGLLWLVDVILNKIQKVLNWVQRKKYFV